MSPASDLAEVRRRIQFGIERSDDIVLVFDYIDRKGNKSQRTASACYVFASTLKAFDVQRGNFRNFDLRRISNVRFSVANDCLVNVECIQ